MTNKQSKIEKLVAELCPNGVEFKSIGEICQIKRGRVMSKDYLKDNAGKYPVYSSQTADNGIFGRINTYDYDGEYLTWTTDGAYAGSIFYRKGKFSITNVCGLLKAKSDDVNMKFLSYILATVSKNYVSSGMGNPKIMSNVMEKIKIPLPPIAIQKEIVKILDSFTELEADLEAELEARKKQYEYYREELLTHNDEARMAVLGKVLKRTKGTPITAGQMSKLNREGAPIKIFAGGKTVAYVNYGDIPDKDVLTKESVVVKSRGIIAFEYIDKPFSHKNEFWSYYSNDPDINIKYIYYYLKNKELYFQTIGQKMSKMPQLSIPNTDKFQIPIPSLPKQERIVSILDKFDALVNDISIGLPAEILARKQQYEYYRGKLLTFKEYAKQ